MKLPAMVHVDLDSLLIIAEFFGVCIKDTANLIHTVAVPRFLELFRKHGIQATFFVVGRDVADETTSAPLRQAVVEGHEIANHTMNHPFRMSALSREKKTQEIIEGHAMLRDRLGVEPVGFRAPGYDIDEETLAILQDQNYLYDSSLFPSFLVPAIKIYTAMVMRGKQGHAADGYGKWTYGFGPIGPYHPCKGSLRTHGEMPIVEIPLSMMPLVRLPLHSTTMFTTSLSLLRFGNRLLARLGMPYTFLLHGVDLLDFEGDQVPQLLSICPTLRKGLSERLTLLNGLLSELIANRQVIRSLDYVKTLQRDRFMKHVVPAWNAQSSVPQP